MKCPYCKQEPTQTAFCYKHSPVGDCVLAKYNVRHLHHFCNASWPSPKHSWIEVIKEEYETRLHGNSERNDSISEG